MRFRFPEDVSLEKRLDFFSRFHHAHRRQAVQKNTPVATGAKPRIANDQGAPVLHIPDQPARTLLQRDNGNVWRSLDGAIRLDEIPDRYAFKKLYPEGREWINKGNSCIVDPRGQVV